jgi:hypothetical protein
LFGKQLRRDTHRRVMSAASATSTPEIEGVTPTTGTGTPSIKSIRPTTAGSRLNFRSQYRSVMTAAGEAERLSSLGESRRPADACRPSVSK